MKAPYKWAWGPHPASAKSAVQGMTVLISLAMISTAVPWIVGQDHAKILLHAFTWTLELGPRSNQLLLKVLCTYHLTPHLFFFFFMAKCSSVKECCQHSEPSADSELAIFQVEIRSSVNFIHNQEFVDGDAVKVLETFLFPHSHLAFLPSPESWWTHKKWCKTGSMYQPGQVASACTGSDSYYRNSSCLIVCSR